MYGRIIFNLAGNNNEYLCLLWNSDGVVDHRAGSLRSFRPMSAPCEIPSNLTLHSTPHFFQLSVPCQKPFDSTVSYLRATVN